MFDQSSDSPRETGRYSEYGWLETKKSFVTGVVRLQRGSYKHQFCVSHTLCGITPDWVKLVDVHDARVDCPGCRKNPFFFEAKPKTMPL